MAKVAYHTWPTVFQRRCSDLLQLEINQAAGPSIMFMYEQKYKIRHKVLDLVQTTEWWEISSQIALLLEAKSVYQWINLYILLDLFDELNGGMVCPNIAPLLMSM